MEVKFDSVNENWASEDKEACGKFITTCFDLNKQTDAFAATWAEYGFQTACEYLREEKIDKHDLIVKDLQEKLKEQSDHYENVINKKLEDQKKWLCDVFKSSELTFELFDRADLIGNAEAMDSSQEAAHYNWLDHQNEKLEKENWELRKALDKFITKSNCLSIWVRDETMSKNLSEHDELLHDGIVFLYEHQCNVESKLTKEQPE